MAETVNTIYANKRLPQIGIPIVVSAFNIDYPDTGVALRPIQTAQANKQWVIYGVNLSVGTSNTQLMLYSNTDLILRIDCILNDSKFLDLTNLPLFLPTNTALQYSKSPTGGDVNFTIWYGLYG